MTLLKHKIRKNTQRYLRRKHRTNTKIKAQQPEARVIVYRSNLYMRGQLLDSAGNVIAQVVDKDTDGKTKTERAKNAGITLAKQAIDKKIDIAAFDRNGFLYHGRVKAFAEGLREGGMKL